MTKGNKGGPSIDRPDVGAKRKRLDPRDRKPISSYFEVESLKGTRTATEIREDLAERYGVSAMTILRAIKKEQTAEAPKATSQQVLVYLLRQAKHEEDLTDVALKFIERIRYFKRICTPVVVDERLDDIVLTKNLDALLPRVDGGLLDGLLDHLKAELPELQPVQEWGQMKPRDCNDGLLSKISAIARSRSFKGTCEGCPRLRRSPS
jgi:hypothetical protein